MCLLFYDSRSDADLADFPFKLILANTRDEFYDRPTKEAFLWEETEKRRYPVIAGMDVEAGRSEGTWFGLNPATGRIAVLLNVLMPVDEFKSDGKGRGRLAVDALSPEIDPEAYMNTLNDTADDYNGFKMIIFEPKKSDGDRYGVWHFCNTNEPDGPPFGFPSIPDSSCEVNALQIPSYGFGNNVPGRFWRKVDAGTSAFRTSVRMTKADWKRTGEPVESVRETLTSRLFSVISNRDSYYPDKEIAIRGIGRPDDFLSPYSRIFIRMPAVRYGTRTQTVLTVDREDNCVFTEVTMSAGSDDVWTKTEIRLKLGPGFNRDALSVKKETVPAPNR